jgi:type 1 glutamine amidotransferase
VAELAQAGLKHVKEAPGVRHIDYGAKLGRPGGAVWLQQQSVLFGGPAVVNGPRARLPGSNTGGWATLLRELDELRPARVVPGFGSWGSGAILERQQRFLLELRRQVAYHITMGRAEADIEKMVLLPAKYYVWMPYDDPQAEDIRHVYRELTAPNAPFYGAPPSSPDAQALVLIGDRYHEPEHIIEGLHPVFHATGVTPHYTVDVQALTAANLSRVKLLVILRDGMLWPDGPQKPYRIWMTREQEKAVVDFAHNGGGFLNLHNSMGLYPKDGPYLNLVGGRYIGHGPLERFRVEIADPNHPITRGVQPFFSADEQHTPPFDEKRVHLLLRNVSDEGKSAAAGWAYEPGQGRLAHLASGHTREALGDPQFQLLMRNAVNWCLKR